MTSFPGVVARQAESLMDEVRRQKEAQCRQIIQEATQRGRDLTRAARKQARARMRQAILQERQRMETALSRARGRVRTREREAMSQDHRALLDEGWTRLQTAMASRWQDKRGRLSWCQAALVRAEAAFGPATVRVTHPRDLDEKDRRYLSQWARERLDQELEWQDAADMTAGVKIHLGGVCLDASVEGLLGDRPGVEAMLLAAWAQAAAGPGGDAHAGQPKVESNV